MCMESFSIVGKNKKSVNMLRDTLVRLGFLFKKRKPDMIISLGGDGTFLFSEREHPGIPKLLIRDSDICKKCNNLEFDQLFMKIKKGDYLLTENFKLQAFYNGKRRIAVNDVVIRNKSPIQALRFQVSIDGKALPLTIGDGAIVSTPFGSTAYYYSITGKKFSEGIGLAFNNPTKPMKSRVLPDGSMIKIKIIRHEAELSLDNDPEIMTMKPGETATIRRSRQLAKIIKVL